MVDLALGPAVRHTAPSSFKLPEASSIMVFAYLDPAAGGMIIQTIIAAAVALPFILRTQITRGLARLRSQRGPKSTEGTQESD